MKTRFPRAGLAAALCGLALAAAAGPAPGPATNAAPAAPVPSIAAPRTHKLEEEELVKLLTAALNGRIAEDGAVWELRLTRPWAAVTVPDETLTAEILEPALNRVTATCILRFELRTDTKTVGSWQAPVQARLWREVLVAKSTLQRGMPVHESDFNLERRDILALRGPLALLSPALDYEITETVSAGAPLTARAVRLKPVLMRGQLADAIIRQGAMSISLKVEVLEEGVPGQFVRVRNPQSHRELRGKVLNEQTVAIPL
jgi:flagella basal body P-ring formation protein FlgA